LVGYIPIWFTRPQTVTHPGTNQVRRSATTLIEANALPLSQTANHWHGTDARTDMAKTCCLCCSIRSLYWHSPDPTGGSTAVPQTLWLVERWFDTPLSTTAARCEPSGLTSVTSNQGDHLSGKPGNVREFDSCQGNVRDFIKSQGKNLVREKLPQTVYCKLHICVHTGI